MTHAIRFAFVALLVGACAPKGDAVDGATKVDSTAMTDSVGMAGIDSAGIDSAGIDSAGAMLGSPPLTLRDSATKGSAATKETKSQTTGVIGRDSAFGPTFVIDSTGKMVRIPVKKP